MKGSNSRYNIALEEKRSEVERSKSSEVERKKRKAEALLELQEAEARARVTLQSVKKRRQEIEMM